MVTTNVSFIGFRKPEDADVDIFYKPDGNIIPLTAATGLHTTGAAEMGDGDFIKLLSWYDNEWGYSSRCVDLIKFLADKGL